MLPNSPESCILFFLEFIIHLLVLFFTISVLLVLLPEHLKLFTVHLKMQDFFWYWRWGQVGGYLQYVSCRLPDVSPVSLAGKSNGQTLSICCLFFKI